MPIGKNPKYTDLDHAQVLKKVYDPDNDQLRVQADISMSGSTELVINQVDDSVAIGDGSKLYTGTDIGSKHALDVNVLDPVTPYVYTTMSEYGETNNIAINGSETLVTFTTPSTGTFYLTKILYSSDSIAQLEVQLNGTTLSKQRLPYGTNNGNFDFSFSPVPGLNLPPATVITVLGTNQGTSGPANMNATLIGVTQT